MPPTIQIAGGGIPSVYTVESVTELKGIKYGTDKGTQGTQQGRSPQEGSNRETEIPYRSENDGSRLLPPADTIA